MANPNGLVMMPTRDNMSLTLLAKPVFCHEGNLIDLTSRSRCAKFVLVYIVSCFSVLDVSLYLKVAITYHLRENIKSWRAKMLEL